MAAEQWDGDDAPDGRAEELALDLNVVEKLRDEVGPELAAQVCRAAAVDIANAAFRCAAAMRAAEVEQMRRAAHTLAGIAVTVGAGRLAAWAREVEIAGLGGTVPRTFTADTLEQLGAEAIAAIEAWLAINATSV